MEGRKGKRVGVHGIGGGGGGQYMGVLRIIRGVWNGTAPGVWEGCTVIKMMYVSDVLLIVSTEGHLDSRALGALRLHQGGGCFRGDACVLVPGLSLSGCRSSLVCEWNGSSPYIYHTSLPPGAERRRLQRI